VLDIEQNRKLSSVPCTLTPTRHTHTYPHLVVVIGPRAGPGKPEGAWEGGEDVPDGAGEGVEQEEGPTSEEWGHTAFQIRGMHQFFSLHWKWVTSMILLIMVCAPNMKVPWRLCPPVVRFLPPFLFLLVLGTRLSPSTCSHQSRLIRGISLVFVVTLLVWEWIRFS